MNCLNLSKYSLKKALTASTAASFLLISSHAAAIDWTAEEYEFVTGDYDNNGVSDLIIRPAFRFVILHGEIATPIAYRNEHYLVTPTSTETNGLYNIDADSVSDAWPENFQAVYGDFNGDGQQDALLQPAASGDALLIYGGSVEAIAINQKLDSVQFGDLSQSNVTITATDHNGDGKDDLLVSEIGGSPIVIYSGDTGFTQVDNQFTESGNVTELIVDSDTNAIFVKHSGFDTNTWNCPNQEYAALSPSNTMFNEIYFQLLSAKTSGVFIDLYIRGCNNHSTSRPNISHTRIEQ